MKVFVFILFITVISVIAISTSPPPAALEVGEGLSARFPRFADSVFTQALPPNPAIARDSAKWLGAYGAISFTNIGFDMKPPQFDPGVEIVWAKSSDPLYTVHCDAWKGNSCPGLEGKQIRIPANAKWGSYPSPNCERCLEHGHFDAHLAVISPDGRWEYDFWQADRFPGGSNGRTFVVSSGEAFPVDYFNEFGPPGWNGSATASHRALTAGMMMPEDFLSGTMEHALTIAPPCVNGKIVFPAPGNSGGTCPHGGGLPEGARVFLAMSDAQIQALPIAPAAKIVYRALARYGAFVTDTSDGETVWYVGGAPNVSTWTDQELPDPWPDVDRKVGLPVIDTGSFHENVLDMTFPPGLQNYLRVADPCVTRGASPCKTATQAQ
ncbi:MAG TPA: hypothetical protein VGZ00_06815 [Candidatus Baltobacteraceae bacterium]|nr:hypothetical protein [Candidatus Baltobacteraceae bacterium]